MIFEMLRWWYGPGWIHAFKRIKTRTSRVSQAFSTGVLLKTFFSPWKRIQYAGKSFDAKIQAMVDNFVSRMIGMVVRLSVLIAALFMTIGSLIISITIVLVWPLIPFGILYFTYKGLAG